MNFHKRHRPELPSFQFTPMIDVVFLLLCFFITTTVFSQWEYEVDIVLPTSQSGKAPDRLPGEIIVNVDRGGAFSVNQVPQTAAQLRERLVRLARVFPGQPVIIRADRLTAYEHVMQAIDVCRLANIWNLSFATRDPERSAPQE
jgi:biopolymer transport protein ExbD